LLTAAEVREMGTTRAGPGASAIRWGCFRLEPALGSDELACLLAATIDDGHSRPRSSTTIDRVPLDTPVFPPEEYEARLDAVRRSMQRRGLDGALISSPENIYYLCGLDHMGYFAYQGLVVPLDGPVVLITRAMERATVRDQVPHLDHVGYSDGAAPPPSARTGEIVLARLSEGGRAVGMQPWEASLGVPARGPNAPVVEISAPVRGTVEALGKAGLHSARVGIEQASTFLPFRVVDDIQRALPSVRFVDCSGLVDDCRIVQSPLELERTRQAAGVSDSMMLAAIAAAGTDQFEHDVMAAIYDTMFRRGGTYPGFVPLVRSTRTLGHEHGTWEAGRLTHGDVLFLEMAGCVRRYHAPLGRLVFIGEAPEGAARILEVCRDAMRRAADAMRPGAVAQDVYAAWQGHLDSHGLSSYTRHHCGYAVGIGYPPSWSGSGVPLGLRKGSTMVLESGMVFHLMSWLLRTGQGDSFLSDTVVVTDEGCERLTRVSHEIYVR
jgi:Xaa-Pro dipeptidase